MPERVTGQVRCSSCGTQCTVTFVDDVADKIVCPKCGKRFRARRGGAAAKPRAPTAAGAPPGTRRGTRKGQSSGAHGGVAVSLADVERMWAGAVGPASNENHSLKSGTEDAQIRLNAALGRSVAPPRPRVVVQGEKSLPDGTSDFLVDRVLGQGGMGVVFAARQATLGRSVALKSIHAEYAADEEVRTKFMLEARMTGILEHPNIVPVHELAVASDGLLFYTMREVKGSPWSARLGELTEAENLDILLKVADALAFAHGHGVIHRDVKPENVMLGDYGEVYLMDWGLAGEIVSEGGTERLSGAPGRCGTPAYMPPEMAAGDGARIGSRSDVYLLGATLYELLTGNRPHHADSVYGCIYAALRNSIRPSDRRDELMDVVYKAMAADPAYRYPSVKAFQAAVRDCREHAASLDLSSDAKETLDRARENGDYGDYARAVFGFGEALRMWPENAAADLGLAMARKSYATAALERGDYELALSQARTLPSAEGSEVQAAAERGKAEQERRARRLKLVSRVAAGLAALVAVVMGYSYWEVKREQRARLAAEGDVEVTTARAAADRKVAEEARAAAEKAKTSAEEWLATAQTAKTAAEASQERARGMEKRLAELVEEAKTARENAARQEAEAAKDREAARREQARLGQELSTISGKLETFNASVSLEDLTEDVTQNNPLLAAMLEELEPWNDDLERKFRMLAVLPAMARTKPDHRRVADAMASLAAAAERNHDAGLAERARTRVEFIRIRLARSQAGARKMTPEKLQADLMAANPDYDGAGSFREERGRGLEVTLLLASPEMDLSPLAGVLVKSLRIARAPRPERSSPAADPGYDAVLDRRFRRQALSLEPLRGLPLESLEVAGIPVASLEPLEKIQLKTLVAEGEGIVSLEPLAGMPLATLRLTGTRVASLAPLAGMASLATLELPDARIADLAPLADLPVTFLNVRGNPLASLEPLAAMPRLARLCLSPLPDRAAMEPLRRIARLESLSSDERDLVPTPGRRLPAPERFWATYDRALAGMARPEGAAPTVSSWAFDRVETGRFSLAEAAAVATADAGRTGRDKAPDPELRRVTAQCVDRAGNLYLALSGGPVILRVDAVTGEAAPLFNLRQLPDAKTAAERGPLLPRVSFLAADSRGNVYAGDRDAPVVWRLTPRGGTTALLRPPERAPSRSPSIPDGARIPVSEFTPPRPGALVIGPKDELYLADAESDLVYHLPFDGRFVQAFRTGLSGISAIALDAEGGFYALTAPDAVHIRERDGTWLRLRPRPVDRPRLPTAAATDLPWLSDQAPYDLRHGAPALGVSPRGDVVVATEYGFWAVPARERVRAAVGAPPVTRAGFDLWAPAWPVARFDENADDAGLPADLSEPATGWAALSPDGRVAWQGTDGEARRAVFPPATPEDAEAGRQRLDALGTVADAFHNRLRAANPRYNPAHAALAVADGAVVGAAFDADAFVSDLAPLAGTGLRWLELSGPKEEVDLAPLAELPLAGLLLSDAMGVRSPEALAGLPLTRLAMDRCGLGSIAFARGLTASSLSFADNAVADLSPLGEASVTELDLSGNRIEDLSFLGRRALMKDGRLTRLDLSRNRIKDLSPLAALADDPTPVPEPPAPGGRGARRPPAATAGERRILPIEWLDLSANRIDDMGLFGTCYLSSPVRLSGNRLARVPALAGGDWDTLYLADNRLADLGGLASRTIRVLDLADNELTDATSLLGCRIDALDVSGNRLSDVGVLRQGLRLREFNKEAARRDPLYDLRLQELQRSQRKAK